MIPTNEGRVGNPAGYGLGVGGVDAPQGILASVQLLAYRIAVLREPTWTSRGTWRKASVTVG